MSIGKALGRVGVVLAVAVAVGLIGCTDEGNSTGGGGNYNNYGEVRIGNQTWTKNINVNTSGSWCYRDSASYCAKYGRLYTWEAAKTACASMGGGYRLPTREDWNNLVTYAGGSVAGTKLKSQTGWYENTGTNEYGFSALPGGARDSDGSFGDVGHYGYWWSATEDGADNAYLRSMRHDIDYVYEGGHSRSYGFSVRCVAAAQ